MEEDDPKIVLIESYFNDIESRIAFLDKLVIDGHVDEAFLLCSVYIESLANGYYQNYGSARGFCTALIDLSKNDLFSYIHPKQLENKLKDNKLFKANIEDIKNKLEQLKNKLYKVAAIEKHLDSTLNVEQKEWFHDYWFKGSMAMIAYERIRCEAVHDMYTIKLSFSETELNGEPVPELDFKLLKSALDEIVLYLKGKSLSERNLFLQHNV